MLHGRVMTIHLIAGLIRITYYEIYCVKDDDVVKENMHDKLVMKVNVIDTKLPKHIMIQINKILKKRLRMLIKMYMILVG